LVQTVFLGIRVGAMVFNSRISSSSTKPVNKTVVYTHKPFVLSEARAQRSGARARARARITAAKRETIQQKRFGSNRDSWHRCWCDGFNSRISSTSIKNKSRLRKPALGKINHSEAKIN
jgi:hypothetical protein